MEIASASLGFTHTPAHSSSGGCFSSAGSGGGGAGGGEAWKKAAGNAPSRLATTSITAEHALHKEIRGGPWLSRFFFMTSMALATSSSESAPRPFSIFITEIAWLFSAGPSSACLLYTSPSPRD